VKSSPVVLLAVYASLQSSLGKRPLDVCSVTQTPPTFEKVGQNFYGKLRFPNNKQE